MAWATTSHDRATVGNSAVTPEYIIPESPNKFKYNLLSHCNEKSLEPAIKGKDDDNEKVSKFIWVKNITDGALKEINTHSFDDLKQKIYTKFKILPSCEINIYYGVNNISLNNKNFDFIEDSVTFEYIVNNEAMDVEKKLESAGKTFRICTASRQYKTLLNATSQPDLLIKIRDMFNIPIDEEIEIVLASNGALIVDNEFVEYSEPNTKYMFLRPGEKWLKRVYGLQYISEENTPTGGPAYLVWRILHDDCTISKLEDTELQKLISMNITDVKTYLISKKCTLFDKEKNLLREIQGAAKNALLNNERGRQAHKFLEELKNQNLN